MPEKVVRTGISVPSDLLREFDELIRVRGYKNRSKAVCDAISHYILEYRWDEPKEDVTGVIALVYDRGTKGISDALTKVEHHFREIVSTTHVHLADDRCLEVVVVKGHADSVKGLAGRLMSQRGVRHLKLLTT